MGSRVLRAQHTVAELTDGIAAIVAEQKIEIDFPPEVIELARAASDHPRLPELDLTQIPFVTIDPAGSMDLDQAMHLERAGDGYLVRYAIADLAEFVTPGDALDNEVNRRGESMYGANTLIPLHPKELSEGAASLLPNEIRPANVWSIRLDAQGAILDAKVEKARVRSVAKLDYEGVQKLHDAGSADDVLSLLRVVGELRIQQEISRGGVSLPMPEQVVDCAGEQWKLEFRTLLPVENWNAQISLLTGFAAAKLMLDAGVGILRTLPPAQEHAVKRLRRTARALGIDWPAQQSYPDFVRSLNPDHPDHAAMVVACTTLLRGAGYAAFNGTVPEQPEHAALASPYAHVTAPLRRLVDRYGLEVCVALCAGNPVPDWVTSAFASLPATMQSSSRRAHAYENAVLNLVEAETLKGRVGERFAGVVLEADRDDARKGEVMIHQPAVEASVTSQSPLPIGEDVTLTLSEADPATRIVRFSL